MKILLIVLIVLLCLFFLYLLYGLLVVFFVNKKLFLVRGTDPDNPCYLRLSDYPELEREGLRIGFYGEMIQGYLYRQKNEKDDKGLIILSHGFFGTHIQYLADIYYLTKRGYTVLAYDQYGVGDSEGKNQVSLSNGIYVLENVLHDVIKNNINQGKDILLYGHSWGAFVSLGALKKYPIVKKAIIRSGFVSPIKEVLYLLKMQNKGLYYSVRPLYSFCYFLIFGKRNMKTVKSAKTNNTEILVLHAKDDKTVPYEQSIAKRYIDHPKKNVTVRMTEQGDHNSLIAKEGLENYAMSVSQYQKILSDKGEDKEKRIDEFVSHLNRREMYPYNQEVINIIDDFLKS